jgi:hypothetical protein
MQPLELPARHGTPRRRLRATSLRLRLVASFATGRGTLFGGTGYGKDGSNRDDADHGKLHFECGPVRDTPSAAGILMPTSTSTTRTT